MDSLSSLILSVDVTARRFAALAFDGERVHAELNATSDDRDALARLARLADGVPVVTDSPRRASDLISRSGVAGAQVWDVLELAALLVPACPGPLNRAAEFFGIVLDRTGVLGQAYRALMLFQLLLATLDRVDTQTLLLATRLAAGLEWPLQALLGHVQRQRALSALETGVLAAGTPIGAWITQAASPRRRSKVAVPDADPPPLDPEDIARRLAADAGIAQALDGFEPRHEQVRMAQVVAE
ncbi:MAG TPA: hypothetical protein VFG86_28245, partial [Chloroflexota bacterium]|nr:hypothetical protein [Chloroflexota bacterium]